MDNKPTWLDKHIVEIKNLQAQINALPDEDITGRIILLSKQLVFIGKVSAELSEDYKKIYATRRRVHAEAYIAAASNKAQQAELAVIEWRMKEAEAYGDMKRWNNGFDSTREELNALKYRLKVAIEDGSSRSY